MIGKLAQGGGSQRKEQDDKPWMETYVKDVKMFLSVFVGFVLKDKGTSFKFWVSWVDPLVKNPPAIQETLVQILGQEVPL